MKGLRLYKAEKLCSEIAIGQLFDRSNPAVKMVFAYPLMMVWTVDSSRSGPAVARFLVSVPKKRLRHAVERVKMRRRIRESYRLNRALMPQGVKFNLAFIYVASEVLPSARIVPAMRRLLGSLNSVDVTE